MFRRVSRRDFLKASAGAATGSIVFPYLGCGSVEVSRPLTRTLGRSGFEVTTLGLGGQASLQWTPEGIDPVAIIVRAIDAGVNYLDTSNVYGPSQQNYGKAFRELNLVPGLPGYDEARRRSVYLASKTMVRHARGSHPDVRDRSEGGPGSSAVDDIRRTLTQVFGDGEGNYPDGAYIDLFQIHNLNTMEEVDAIYLGLDNPDPQAERIGAFAALVDYRDGTNRTGLNPRQEKLIRHIGITGHFSSPVMMECLQRDEQGMIETMLIAINANDRQYLNHQHNAIPVARAKNVGVIGMKVFADGAMYTKEPRWSGKPEDVVRFVGTERLPSRPLVEYALSTPGVATAIIGIGQIDDDPRQSQLAQNLSAAQIQPESLGEGDRAEIEQLALRARDGQTNWFQLSKQPLGAPRDVNSRIESREGKKMIELSWQTAYAADEPLEYYEILRDDLVVGRVQHEPQISKAPFRFEEVLPDENRHIYQVVSVDRGGNRSAGEELLRGAV